MSKFLLDVNESGTIDKKDLDLAVQVRINLFSRFQN